MELQETKIVDLQEYAKGQLVRLPDFAEGQPFIARLKRPSLLGLIKSGKIPNSLIGMANKLFVSNIDETDEENPELLKELFNVIDVMCAECFVSPSYEDIKQAGIQLTDDQYMFVFNYTQRGVKALENFRTV